MAKQKTVWIDDNGTEHESDAAAERANVRIKAERVLAGLEMLPCGLKKLEGVNHQTLQPLQAYIDLLVRESMERTEKYG